ncbi:hypothetical protein [Flammeovirga sp. EKP202]|uniref:hypothetical protein n=1 Tax=Flammeovirga sp. EKP202 TaxID=2770592 RepID=UPI00165F2C34|nr:hypothetical protein [Flammeovirga sp. EKP202]MBD0401226.1 hypothetical protein [Flammeovirga sp. EKP202]
MKKLFIILFTLISIHSFGQSEWRTPDKSLHKAVGYTIGAGSYLTLSAIPNIKPEEKLIISVGVTTIVATSKELMDMTEEGNKFCSIDLWKTATRGAIGAGVLYGIDKMFFQKKRKNRKIRLSVNGYQF